MGKISMVDVLNSVNDIPAFPEQFQKILSMIEVKSVTVQAIEAEIMKDQALTVKVLKMANSVYYGMSRRVDTVAKATVVLGFKGIKSIILTYAVNKAMNVPLIAYGLKADEFWRQSLVCAYTSRLIAKEIGYKEADQAYTAGLLRDIGKIVSEKYLEDELGELNRLIKEEHKDYAEVEVEILGFTHMEIGAKLAQRWRLPEELVEAIEHHHKPYEAKITPKLVGIVSLSNSIIGEMWKDLKNDDLEIEYTDYLEDLLGIDRTAVDSVIFRVKEAMTSGELFLDM